MGSEWGVGEGGSIKPSTHGGVWGARIGDGGVGMGGG